MLSGGVKCRARWRSRITLRRLLHHALPPLLLLLLTFLMLALRGMWRTSRPSTKHPMEQPPSQQRQERQKPEKEHLTTLPISSQRQVETRLKEDYERGRRLLSDMDSIRRANSHILPLESYFNGDTAYNPPQNDHHHQEKRLCAGEDENNCVGKFVKGLSSVYTAAPKYKILGCLIRKNMNTLLHAILCYLSNEEKILASGITLSSLAYSMHHGLNNGLCNAKYELYESKGTLLNSSHSSLRNPITRHEPEWVLDESWRLLAVVREPVDRFLSGFLDKCIRNPMHATKRRNATASISSGSTTTPLANCNGCGQNLTCFVITEYRRMKEFEWEAKRRLDINKDGNDADDDDNAHNNHLDDMENTREDMHFFPQNWRCDFERSLLRYTRIEYLLPTAVETPRQGSGGSSGGGGGDAIAEKPSHLPTRLASFLAHAGVGAKSLSYIRHHLEKDTTHHVTHNTEARRFLEQRLRSSPFLMEFLVRMFYWDFRLLGFPLPKLNWGRPLA